MSHPSGFRSIAGATLRLAGPLAAATWLLVACAGEGRAPAVRGEPDRSASAAEGAAIAARACGTCHALGVSDESAWPGAPPFRAMRLDLRAISYEHRLAQLHAGQNRGMPPPALTAQELRSLQAYIDDLGR